MAVIKSGVTGSLVPGWSGGGIGSEKSAARLYHWVGISDWVSVNRVGVLKVIARFGVENRQRIALPRLSSLAKAEALRDNAVGRGGGNRTQ